MYTRPVNSLNLTGHMNTHLDLWKFATWGFMCKGFGLRLWLSIKESTCNAGGLRFDSWVGEANGNPLQYSCLGNPMDKGAWWPQSLGLKKRWTLLRELNNINNKAGGLLYQQIPHVHSVNNHVGKMYCLCIWAPSYTSSIEKSRRYIEKYTASVFAILPLWVTYPIVTDVSHSAMGFSEFCVIYQHIFVCSSNLVKKFLLGIIVLTKHFSQCDYKFII